MNKMPTWHMHTTCQHAPWIYQHAICSATCRYAGTICMREVHAHYTTWHSPKIKVHDEPIRGFPSITFLENTFEVAEKPSPLGNKYKGQLAEPLTACQAPWGTLHQIYQGCTHVWQFPRATDMTDNWENLCLLLCYLLKFFLEPLY